MSSGHGSHFLLVELNTGALAVHALQLFDCPSHSGLSGGQALAVGAGVVTEVETLAGY